MKIGILGVGKMGGAILNGMLFSKSKTTYTDKKSYIYQPSIKNSNILADSMIDSINSILLVGGYIVFSFVLIELFNNLHIIPTLSYVISKIFQIDNYNIVKSILNGCIEMTGGLISLGNTNSNNLLNISISSFLIAFGGASIFLQSLNFTKELQIKKSYFLLQKFCQGILTLLISLIVCFIINLFQNIL